MDWCEFKNSIKHRIYKEHYVWNSSTCACEINKYLKSIVHDLAIACNEIIDMSIIVSVNLNNKKATWKMHDYDDLLTFLLVTIFLKKLLLLAIIA